MLELGKNRHLFRPLSDMRCNELQFKWYKSLQNICFYFLVFKTRSNWARMVRDMNMSTMSMSGRGCVAWGGRGGGVHLIDEGQFRNNFFAFFVEFFSWITIIDVFGVGCFSKDTLKKNKMYTPPHNWGRPERWIVTIPSSDQWLATIGNHWKTIATNGFGDQKPLKNHC